MYSKFAAARSFYSAIILSVNTRCVYVATSYILHWYQSSAAVCLRDVVVELMLQADKFKNAHSF